MRTKGNLIWGAIWAASLVLAGYAGWQWRDDTLAVPLATGEEAVIPGMEGNREAPADQFLDAGADPQTMTLEREAPAPQAAGSPVQLLRRSLDEEDPVARMKNLLNALEGMNPDNVEQFADMMSTLSGREDGQILTYFIHEWAQFDPKGAIAYAGSGNNRRQTMWLTSTALRSWGKEDPDSALSYLEDSGMMEENGFYLPGLLSGWADTDPAAATRYAMGIEDDQLRQRSLWGVARELASADVEQIKITLNSLGDAPAQSELLAIVTGRLSRDDPEQSLNLLQEMDPAMENPRAVSELIEGWVDSDPAAASSFVMELPPGEARESGLVTLVDRWSRRDPVGAGEWLNQFPPDPALDEPVAAYVNRVERTDPEGALSWAGSITETSTRNDLMTEVATRWMARDEAAARRYLESAQVPDEVRETVMERIPPPEKAE